MVQLPKFCVRWVTAELLVCAWIKACIVRKSISGCPFPGRYGNHFVVPPFSNNQTSVCMGNVLETYGDAPKSTPTSVVSDEPKVSNVFQTNQQEEIVLVEAEQPKSPTKAEPKKFHTQAGIQKFFHQLHQRSSPMQSSNITVEKTNESAMLKRTQWTVWRIKAKKQKAAQKQKSIRSNKGFSNTDDWMIAACAGHISRRFQTSFAITWI